MSQKSVEDSIYDVTGEIMVSLNIFQNLKKDSMELDR